MCLTKPIGKYNLIVVAFITSKLNQDKLATDILLNEGTQTFVESNLPLPSSIKMHKLGYIEFSQIEGLIGELTNVDEIQNKLKLVFGLD